VFRPRDSSACSTTPCKPLLEAGRSPMVGGRPWSCATAPGVLRSSAKNAPVYEEGYVWGAKCAGVRTEVWFGNPYQISTVRLS